MPEHHEAYHQLGWRGTFIDSNYSVIGQLHRLDPSDVHMLYLMGDGDTFVGGVPAMNMSQLCSRFLVGKPILLELNTRMKSHILSGNDWNRDRCRF